MLPVGTLEETLATLAVLRPHRDLPGILAGMAGVAGSGGSGGTAESARSPAPPSVPEGEPGAQPGHPAYVVAPPRAVWLSPLVRSRHGYAVTPDALLVRSGRLRRSVEVVPHARIQSLRVRQGPLQRRLGLASVQLLTTPGPADPWVRHLDTGRSRRPAECPGRPLGPGPRTGAVVPTDWPNPAESGHSVARRAPDRVDCAPQVTTRTEKGVSTSAQAAAPGSAAAKLGFTAGQVIQEFGYDDDVDDDLRFAIEDLTTTELEDEDYADVADAVMIWWRDDDGDLVDTVVDALTNLADHGFIVVLTPKAGRPSHVDASDIEEAATTAGLHTSGTVNACEDWTATKLVAPRSARR